MDSYSMTLTGIDYSEENKYFHVLHDTLPLPVAEEIFSHISEKLLVLGSGYDITYEYYTNYPVESIDALDTQSKRLIEIIREHHDKNHEKTVWATWGEDARVGLCY